MEKTITCAAAETIRSFSYGVKKIRVVEKDGKYWFNVSDVRFAADLPRNSSNDLDMIRDEDKAILAGRENGRYKTLYCSRAAVEFMLNRGERNEYKSVQAFTAWLNRELYPALGLAVVPENQAEEEKGPMREFSDFRFGKLRVVLNGNTPWFVVADVCRGIGLAQTTIAMRRVKEQDKTKYAIQTSGGEQELLCVNHSGLMNLIEGSRKKVARDYKNWLIAEIFPVFQLEWTFTRENEMTTISGTQGLEIYQNERLGNVRVKVVDNEIWFAATDVCGILEISDTSQAMERINNRDKRMFRGAYSIRGSKHPQTMWFVNESGLYSLILDSNKPQALEFKHWITDEVIPSIRKTGMYATPRTAEQIINDPDKMIDMLQDMIDVLRESKRQRAAKESAELERDNLLEAQERDKPLVNFANQLITSNDDISVGDLAKLMHQNGRDIGQTRLFQLLREDGYLMRQSSSYNLPTQKSMNMGLMRIREIPYRDKFGKMRISETSCVTPKGQQYFLNLYLNRKREETVK